MALFAFLRKMMFWEVGERPDFASLQGNGVIGLPAR